MEKSTVDISKFEQEITAAIEGSINPDATEALRELIADGMRFRMMNHEPPIHPYFVNLNVANMADEYMKFLDAVSDRVGVCGPSGEEPKYYFAQLPAGGKWEDAGLDGAWEVLRKGLVPTPDGHAREGTA